jgi:hypothetical protein
MVDYVGVLVDLKERRGTLAEEIRELDALIEGVERMVSRFSRSPQQVRLITDNEPILGQNRVRDLAKLTMPEAIRFTFESLPAPTWLTTRQVQDAVAAGGIKGGKNMRGHVYNTLHRLSQGNGPFRRNSEGRWALRSWNLGGEGVANHA